WRYLGFYFDGGLNFREHVRYYSTKALTTVKAMTMLGNSTHGLLPKHKCLLYRSCVVPVATYGYRLWFHKGARYVGLLKLLTTMQRKAALWITGAFRTSPSGGAEALAGLMPIHLHLSKLVERSSFRTTTLHPSHPLHSLLDWQQCGSHFPHQRSYARLSPS